MTTLSFANGKSTVDLNGNAGKTVELQAGANSQLLSFEYASQERLVSDLELRLQVLSPIGSAATTSYQVLYRVEVAAGESTFVEPRQSIFNRTEPVNEHVLPDRGTIMRLNARGVKVGMRLVQLVAPIERVKVMVSVQPAAGGEPPQVPPITLAKANAQLTAFPLTARRFRVRRSDGTPWAAAANLFTLYNLCGRSFGNVDAANYADWTPVPTPASFMLFVNDSIVEYQ